MKAYSGVDVQIYIFLISALDVGEWLAPRPCRFNPGEGAPPPTRWIGGWVGLLSIIFRLYTTVSWRQHCY
jgi:hypothetical protein